jgi:hypothetical protein
LLEKKIDELDLLHECKDLRADLIVVEKGECLEASPEKRLLFNLRKL